MCRSTIWNRRRLTTRHWIIKKPKLGIIFPLSKAWRTLPFPNHTQISSTRVKMNTILPYIEKVAIGELGHNFWTMGQKELFVVRLIMQPTWYWVETDLALVNNNTTSVADAIAICENNRAIRRIWDSRWNLKNNTVITCKKNKTALTFNKHQ